MRARWGGAPLAEQDDGDSELEQQLLSRRAKHPSWSIDRGSCYFQQARERNKRPSLVETGRSDLELSPQPLRTSALLPAPPTALHAAVPAASNPAWG